MKWMNKEGEFRFRWVLITFLILSFISLESERYYVKYYDQLAPSCVAKNYCPWWFVILGLTSGITPALTLFTFFILIIRIIGLIKDYWLTIKKQVEPESEEDDKRN